MQPSDGNRFRNLLIGIGRVYSQEPDALMLDAYWVALRDWPMKDFELACAQLLKTSKFMPRPADFTQLRDASRLTAGEAWALVLDIARSGDYQHGHVLEDAQIAAAVRAIGGYHAIGMSNTDQTPFLERRFAEHYDAIGEREDIREALPAIAGEPRARVCGPRSLLQVTDDSFNRPDRRS